MKKVSRVFIVVLAFAALLLNACASSASAASPVAGSKPLSMPTEFTGTIETINGNEWTIDGQTLTIDPAIIKDGPFGVGDQVKVEVTTQPDGSVVVSRVEQPTDTTSSTDIGTPTAAPEDNSNSLNDDNSSLTSDGNSTDDHGTDASLSNDDSNDDHGTDSSLSGSNSSDDNSSSNSSTSEDNSNSNSKDNSTGGSNSNDDNNGGGSGSGTDDGSGHG